MVRFNVPTIVAALTLTTLATTFAGSRQAVARTAPPTSFTAKTALVRVVHGSPDAGPVVVSVDGKPVIKNFLYGTITPYLALPAGSYRLAVTTASGASVSLRASVSAGRRYSIVATGELSPKLAPKQPDIALTAYVDAPFTSPEPAVAFHHAAPVAKELVSFGYGLLADPTNEQLARATFGGESGPIDLPLRARDTPIELYAVGVGTVTLIPNQLDPLDVRNVLPSAAGQNISTFAIDGPAAASVPSISGIDAVRLIGTFDTNGE